jgi:acetylornithine/N-succinyldiaminopimelate aminotransferase
VGDHGGTYNGNPLGCAVAAAVVDFLTATNIQASVERMGELCRERLQRLQECFPFMIREIRGSGLLFAVEFQKPECAAAVQSEALDRGLILNLKHGMIFRIFPALTITEKELSEGLDLLAATVNYCAFA